jgi:hypothetical protein
VGRLCEEEDGDAAGVGEDVRDGEAAVVGGISAAVVGPLAPSARMRHLMRPAFPERIWFSVAHGDKHVALAPGEFDLSVGIAARQALRLASGICMVSPPTPPMPPPKGALTTAHFQVLNAANALTSAIETSGRSGCRLLPSRVKL